MNRIYILLLMVLLAYGCKRVENNVAQNDKSINDTSYRFKGSEQMKAIYHRFPSPEEMLLTLDVQDIRFDADLINPSEKNEEYLDSRTQALNLGVYVADLAYLTLFKQHKESMEYFEALYLLSDKLRISSAFDVSLLKRVQENMTNSDSLQALSDFAFTSITNYLEKNDNEKTFALISIGAFVETLYLSIRLVGDFEENSQIVQLIADQKFVLENIIRYSSNFISDKAVLTSINSIEPIRTIYNELDMVKTETVVTKDENGKLVIKGGDRVNISEEQFLKLKELVFSTRNTITQN